MSWCAARCWRARNSRTAAYNPTLRAGPAFLLTDVDPEFTLGVKVGAGLSWQLHRHVALFGEYRFTHFSPEIETGGVVVGPVETGDLEIETDVNTHHVLAGLSFRF
jgi:opacity protein-like surface antigen